MKAVEKKAVEGPESEIRTLIDDWSEAISNKDIDSILAHYAEEVIAFDVPPPLQLKGRKALRTNIENWLEMFEGPIQVEFEDQNTTISGDLAMLHQLARISDKSKGEGSGTWVRVTVCYQKIGGRWLVIHEHASVPFGMSNRN
jgi:uncharacterized protein (TIGR02246 family)